MNIEYKEHIGIFKNVYPEGYCQHLIDQFNVLHEKGVGSNRQNSENISKHLKDDYQIVASLSNHNLDPFEIIENGENIRLDPVTMFFDGLQSCYNEYTEVYSILRDSGNIRASSMKMQKTSPGGGYHVWHSEQGSGPSSNRVLVYALYLNDLNVDGGETEFLYQKMRFKPEQNTMLFWPAAYTHTHRGNPVLGDTDKYIVTGWFYYD